MGHCMSGSQLPAERNKPHYLHIAQQKHELFFFIEAGKHPLNIHVSLLSESDMNLALMDRKCLGQLFGMNGEKAAAMN